jgi:hypothetical protein
VSVDFAAITACPVLLVRKARWPAASLAETLAGALDRWARANRCARMLGTPASGRASLERGWAPAGQITQCGSIAEVVDVRPVSRARIPTSRERLRWVGKITPGPGPSHGLPSLAFFAPGAT